MDWSLVGLSSLDEFVKASSARFKAFELSFELNSASAAGSLSRLNKIIWDWMVGWIADMSGWVYEQFDGDDTVDGLIDFGSR